MEEENVEHVNCFEGMEIVWLNWTLFSLWLFLTSSTLALLLFTYLEAKRTRREEEASRKESYPHLMAFVEEAGCLEVDAGEVREELSEMYATIPETYVERTVVAALGDRRMSTTSILRQRSDSATAAEAMLEVIMGGGEQQQVLDSALSLWEDSDQPAEENQRKLSSEKEPRRVSWPDQSTRERKRKKGVMYSRTGSGPVSMEAGQLEVIHEL